MMDLSDDESFLNGSSNEQNMENVFEGNDNLQQSGGKTLKREPAHRFIYFSSSFSFLNLR
jgi:hypothetical protein